MNDAICPKCGSYVVPVYVVTSCLECGQVITEPGYEFMAKYYEKCTPKCCVGCPGLDLYPECVWFCESIRELENITKTNE